MIHLVKLLRITHLLVIRKFLKQNSWVKPISINILKYTHFNIMHLISLVMTSSRNYHKTVIIF